MGAMGEGMGAEERSVSGGEATITATTETCTSINGNNISAAIPKDPSMRPLAGRQERAQLP
jgi:hypothetical protein